MSHAAWIRAAALIGLSLGLSAAPAWGQSEGSSPTDGALADSAWYDAAQRQVLPVPVEPIVEDSLNRNSRWLPKAERLRQPKSTNTASSGGGSGIFGSGLTMANLLGWMLLLAVVAAAIGALAYALSRTDFEGNAASRTRSGDGADTPDAQTVERMKHLPAELRRTDVNLRSEAQRLMNEGQYDQAIILLFGHQLLLLDRHTLLRLSRGKTNRKYVRETRASDPDSAARLQATVTAFERSYFGGHAITAPEFAELWQSGVLLEQAVARRGEAAA